ncbi:hypothetical protein [Streptomyces sp. YS-3]|uniref:hypothetical protein n=1 Tax=Streptomyces sp. YS-3 TaxID=3381352 RepID=UPI0038625C90
MIRPCPTRLTTERRADGPPPVGEEWETAVDVSIYSSSGTLWLFQWGGDVVEEAGDFATAGPGWYRVRVQARGRDAGEAIQGEDVVEEHALTVWPAPPQPDVVHRATDAFARRHFDPARPPGLPVDPDDPTSFLDLTSVS